MKPRRPPPPRPTGLFDELSHFNKPDGDWTRVPQLRSARAIKATYRRAAITAKEKGTVFLYGDSKPDATETSPLVAYRTVPHEDMSDDDRRNMLDSMVFLYNMQFFPSE